MKALILSIINVIIFIISFIIHRLLVRTGYIFTDDPILFWGSLIGILFLLTLIVSLIFGKSDKSM